MNQQQQQLPPRQEMIDARDQLKSFMGTIGWRYLSNIMQAQINGHAQQVMSSAEAAAKELHPMMYALQAEYKKGVHQGLTIGLQLPKMLVEQLSADLARTEEDLPPGEEVAK